MKISTSWRFWLVISFCCFGTLLSADVLIVKAGKLIPVVGPEQTNVSLWIENGRIKKIGKDLKIPWDAKIIDASDKVVFPGMIETATAASLDRANENIAVVPFLSVRESIDPTNIYFDNLLRNGITTVHIIQGTSTVIGGYGAILKPTGNTLESMVRREPGMLRISIASDRNRSRIRKMATLRAALDNTLHYQKMLKIKHSKENKVKAEKTAKTSLSPNLYLDSADPLKQPLIDLLEGRLTALIYCPEPGDCLRALDLAKTYKFKPILQVGPRAFLAIDALKKAGVSVVLDSEILYEEDFKGEDQKEEVVVPLKFHQQQIPFCLTSRGQKYLWYQAGLAVQNGLSRDIALKSITLYPAELLGMQQRVGSLEEGKDADFLILSGDPLDIKSWIEEVWIEGKKVYDRKKDLRLKHFLGEDTSEKKAPKKN